MSAYFLPVLTNIALPFPTQYSSKIFLYLLHISPIYLYFSLPSAPNVHWTSHLKIVMTPLVLNQVCIFLDTSADLTLLTILFLKCLSLGFCGTLCLSGMSVSYYYYFPFFFFKHYAIYLLFRKLFITATLNASPINNFVEWGISLLLCL